MANSSHTSLSADADGLEWIGVRFLDPVGKVFRNGGYYYRAIYPEKIDYIMRLLDSDVFRTLVASGLVIPQETVSSHIGEFTFLLKSRAAAWNIGPESWVLMTLRQAALAWIQISKVLVTRGYQLIDAHYGNYVLSDTCRPTWIDIGSIQNSSVSYLRGFEEFCTHQLNPLIALALKPRLSALFRMSLFKRGLTSSELRALMPYSKTVLLLQTLKQINKFPANQKFETLKAQIVLSLTNSIVKHLPLGPIKTSWATYHEQIKTSPLQPFEPTTSREKIVKQIVERLQPESIIDIGANSGRMLIISARQRMKILAVDPDEYAVTKFVSWSNSNAKTKQVSAVGCIGNFHDLTAEADLVLGLALTHHIALTEKFRFDYVALRFSQLSRSSLITEFMPNGLGGAHRRKKTPEWYSLENFLNELRRFWRTVEVVNYDYPKEWSPRTLIVCTDKI